ncbi:MAG: hypothetical protein LBB82_08090 [Treponema sp.]|jgi:hypothetical protein|nr:hypothetical protein [Treponema sp.]
MKSTKRKVFAVCLVVLAMTMLIAAKKPKQKVQMLDWKGAALGQEVPEWVNKSVESSLAIQSLPEYKDQYCFVVTIENDNKDFAINWVKNLANGSSQVSTMLATTVNSMAEASVSGKKGQDVDMHFTDVRDAMSNASFKNLRQVADFWIYINNKSTKKQYYAAYSLWIVPVKDLNDQIAANFQNIIDNNKAMSEAERQIYLDIITDIRTRGIATNVALADSGI